MSTKVDYEVGIMPQKTYLFWIVLFLIFFIAVVNCLLLIIIMGLLRLSNGLGSIEIPTDFDGVKFSESIDLNQVVTEKGSITGFENAPIIIIGNEGSVSVSTSNKHDPFTSEFRLSGTDVSFSSINKFDVYDHQLNNNIFSTNYKEFAIPENVPRLDVRKLRVNRVVSTAQSNLTIRSDSTTRLIGNEGVRIRGKEVTFTADGDIYLNSVSGNIHLLSSRVSFKNVAVAEHRTHSRLNLQYKLCICMPEGLLFKIPISRDLNVKPSEACNFVDLSPGMSPCAK